MGKVSSSCCAFNKILAIIDETVRSRNLDYSHFISLPLAIHPELVSKLINFQHTILGNDDSCIGENLDTDSNEVEDTDNKEVDQLIKEDSIRPLRSCRVFPHKLWKRWIIGLSQ
ncbi:putative eukaryotic LigT [Trifolium repens]|nr:putative eukaryotic LigT [Trifolium repens]